MKLSDLEKHELPESIVKRWRQRHQKSHPADPDNLTPLQESVFSAPVFWDHSKNLVIQGQTSSGKTLTGEVAIAWTIQQQNRSGIYLVPFRAMVGEKYREFDSALGQASARWRVYPSSSDYQEHDTFLALGRYDLAVMVYEKLFALTARPNNRILNRCGIVIVDECQLLGEPQRGPKVEVILSRLMAEQPSTRIICLTSNSSHALKLSAWLDAEVLANSSRPKQLRETVCTLAGDCRTRIENADGSLAADETSQIDIKRSCASTDDLVLELARLHILSGEKVLIFRATKRNTVLTAQRLAKKLPEVTLPQHIVSAFGLMDEDENIQTLRRRLLVRGVAFHNASLSWEARDLIENEFKRDDGIVRVVIATETLAMGVNLPADVVIVADLRKPGGQDQPMVDVSAHEYKNYIGRAGRFGQGSVNYGKSYLIAESLGQGETLWNRYVDAKPTDILSAFGDLTARDKAPYLLNWIVNMRRGEHGEVEALTRRLKGTFALHERVSEAEFLLKKIVPLLVDARLAEEKRRGRIVATQRGEAVAGFALSLYSVEILEDVCAMLSALDADAPWPLFEIIYNICLCEEVASFTEPHVTTNDFLPNKPLRVLVREGELPVVQGGALDLLRSDSMVPRTEELQAMKRALLLWFWRDGLSVSSIRKDKKIDGFTIGDLGRIAEVAAFVMEALAALAEKYDVLAQRVRSLRELAATVQYGVPPEAVPLASRHVRGLSRLTLGRLCELYKGEDLVVRVLLDREEIDIVPPAVMRRLLEALSRWTRLDQESWPYHREIVTRWVKAGKISKEMRDQVEGVYEAADAPGLLVSLKTLLEGPEIRLKVQVVNQQSLLVSGETAKSEWLLKIFGPSVVPVVQDDLDEWARRDRLIGRMAVSHGKFSGAAIRLAEVEGIVLITTGAFVELLLEGIASGVGANGVLNALEGRFGRVYMEDTGSVAERMRQKVVSKESVPQRDRKQVFLAHCSRDKHIVEEVAAELERAGISYWLDSPDVAWGDVILAKMDEGLRTSEVVLFFVSKASLEGEFPSEEMYAALYEGIRARKSKLLPLLLEDDEALLEAVPLVRGRKCIRWREGVGNVVAHLQAILKED